MCTCSNGFESAPEDFCFFQNACVFSSYMVWAQQINSGFNVLYKDGRGAGVMKVFAYVFLGACLASSWPCIFCFLSWWWGLPPSLSRKLTGSFAMSVIPTIACPRPVLHSARILASLKCATAWTMAFALRMGFPDLKIPDPTKTPSIPSCIISAASAGVAMPPAAKLTTGSFPVIATSLTSS
jgi:hypothetical protein